MLVRSTEKTKVYTVLAYVSIFRARPSNLPTVYMLAVPIAYWPLRASHTTNFPSPRSGPVALKSMSTVQAVFCRVLSLQTAPLWFADIGGVRMTLFERISGLFGSPNTRQLGISLKSGDILHKYRTISNQLTWRDGSDWLTSLRVQSSGLPPGMKIAHKYRLLKQGTPILCPKKAWWYSWARVRF